MLGIFRTLVDLFGYPGDSAYAWGHFIWEHSDMLTDEEYEQAKRWLEYGCITSLRAFNPERN